MSKLVRWALPASAVAALSVAGVASAQLRVGAGKADITPDSSNLPAPYISVHDHIYTRCILITNATTSAVLMNVEAGGIPKSFFERVVPEISKRYGIPPENIVLSATHDHSSVLSWDNLESAGSSGADRPPFMGPGQSPQSNSLDRRDSLPSVGA